METYMGVSEKSNFPLLQLKITRSKSIRYRKRSTKSIFGQNISCTFLFWCTHPIHVVYIVILMHPSNQCPVHSYSDTSIQSMPCTFLFWGTNPIHLVYILILIYPSNPCRVHSYSDPPSNPCRVHSYSDTPIQSMSCTFLFWYTHPIHLVYILILIHPSNPSCVHSFSDTYIQSISCTFLFWYVPPIYI